MIKREIEGVQVEFQVNDASGRFWVLFGEDKIEEDTLDKAVIKAREYLRSVGRVAIPVTGLSTWGDNDPIRHGILVGIHAGTGHPMVKWDNDTRASQVTYGRTLLRRLSKEELLQHRTLIEAEKASREARRAFEEERRLNAKAAVAEVLEAAVQTKEESK